jgi:hypothetical protein
MSRGSKPLPPRAYTAFHDACIEEIHEGLERYGIPCLLALHTGMRRRLVVHYDDSWRRSTGEGEEISLPKQVACTIRDNGGCTYCNDDETNAPDGFLRPKTGAGEERAIPVFEEFYDPYEQETRSTELDEWLDYWFKTHDAGWGYATRQFRPAVFKVAQRRHEAISQAHQGEVERYVQNSTKVVPDIKPHDLRATWCTQCVRQGVKNSTIKDWGGWKEDAMIEHYRGFVGDKGGEGRARYGGTDDEMTPKDLMELLANNDALDTDAIDQDMVDQIMESS